MGTNANPTRKALCWVLVVLFSVVFTAGPNHAESTLFDDDQDAEPQKEFDSWAAEKLSVLMSKAEREDAIGRKLAKKRLKTITKWRKWKNSTKIARVRNEMKRKVADTAHEASGPVKNLRAGGEVIHILDISYAGQPVMPTYGRYGKKQEQKQKQRIRELYREFKNPKFILGTLRDTPLAPNRRHWRDFIEYFRKNLTIRVDFKKRREVITLALDNPRRSAAHVLATHVRQYIELKILGRNIADYKAALKDADNQDRVDSLQTRIDITRSSGRDLNVKVKPADPDIVLIELCTARQSYNKRIVQRAMRELPNFNPRR